MEVSKIFKIFEQFIFRLESGIWVLTADFWKNLFTFRHRNSRSELRRTSKSTIMQLRISYTAMDKSLHTIAFL